MNGQMMESGTDHTKYLHYPDLVSRDGSVDRLEHSGLDARQGQKIFLFLSQISNPALEPTQPPI